MQPGLDALKSRAHELRIDAEAHAESSSVAEEFPRRELDPRLSSQVLDPERCGGFKSGQGIGFHDHPAPPRGRDRRRVGDVGESGETYDSRAGKISLDETLGLNAPGASA